MQSLDLRNGLAELRRFADAAAGSAGEDRLGLLRQHVDLTDDELSVLVGQHPWDFYASAERLAEQWQQMAAADIEGRVQAWLGELGRKYPAPAALRLTILPLDEPAWMQAQDFHGVWGYVADLHLFLFVNPEVPAMATGLENTLVHEYHHFWRMAATGSGRGGDFTLLDAIVYEGLAEYFCGQVLGPEGVGRWAQQLSAGQARQAWLALGPHLASVDEAVRTEYLLGSLAAHPDQWELYRALLDSPHIVTMDGGQNFVPPWAGYSVGYHLVSDYAAQHPDCSLRELTEAPAQAFAWAR